MGSLHFSIRSAYSVPPNTFQFYPLCFCQRGRDSLSFRVYCLRLAVCKIGKIAAHMGGGFRFLTFVIHVLFYVGGGYCFLLFYL